MKKSVSGVFWCLSWKSIFEACYRYWFLELKMAQVIIRLACQLEWIWFSYYCRGWKFLYSSQIPPYSRRVKSGINTETSSHCYCYGSYTGPWQKMDWVLISSALQCHINCSISLLSLHPHHQHNWTMWHSSHSSSTSAHHLVCIASIYRTSWNIQPLPFFGYMYCISPKECPGPNNCPRPHFFWLSIPKFWRNGPLRTETIGGISWCAFSMLMR